MKLSLSTVALLGGQAAAFWRMPCRSPTGIGRLDPIVVPGGVNDHTHIIFGSGNFGLDVSYESLSSANCTSCQVLEDRSAYWTPPLYFMYENGTTVMVEDDGGMLAYYNLFLDNITAFPEGFRMIAGNPWIRNYTSSNLDDDMSAWPLQPTDQWFLKQRALGFTCMNYAPPPYKPEGALARHQFPTKDFLDANCPDGLRLEMAFPSCGNGEIDSPDHHSHVAYPNLVKEGNCPPGYDIHYPFLFFETIWDTYAFRNVSGQFVLSPGDPVGTGYHGDFYMGWKSAEFLQSAIDVCTNKSGEIEDCPLFTIQDVPTAAKCLFDMPDELKDEDSIGPMSGLPINVPIQSGPQPATPYPVAGAGATATATSIPTSTSAPSMSSSLPAEAPTTVPPSSLVGSAGGVALAADSLGAIVEMPVLSTATPSTATSAAPPASTSSSLGTFTTSSAIASAPNPSSEAATDFFATSYITSGNAVLELFVAKTLLTVTATETDRPAGFIANDKRRHVHPHRQS